MGVVVVVVDVRLLVDGVDVWSNVGDTGRRMAGCRPLLVEAPFESTVASSSSSSSPRVDPCDTGGSLFLATLAIGGIEASDTWRMIRGACCCGGGGDDATDTAESDDADDEVVVVDAVADNGRLDVDTGAAGVVDTCVTELVPLPRGAGGAATLELELEDEAELESAAGATIVDLTISSTVSSGLSA